MDEKNKVHKRIIEFIDKIPAKREYTISFVKADGTNRMILTSRYLSVSKQKGIGEGDFSHVLGASVRLKMHKNLLPVYSIEDDGFRQVNLDTVDRISWVDSNKREHILEIERE